MLQIRTAFRIIYLAIQCPCCIKDFNQNENDDASNQRIGIGISVNHLHCKASARTKWYKSNMSLLNWVLNIRPTLFVYLHCVLICSYLLSKSDGVFGD